MAVYSKFLTQTDVSTRLAVNSDRLGNFFPAFEEGKYNQVLDVRDENGKNWGFVFRIRQGQYEKPYIRQATWRPFVVEKQAEVGDEVEFSRKTDGGSGSACRYKIRLIKKEEKAVMENEGKEVIKNEEKDVMENEEKKEVMKNEEKKVMLFGKNIT